MKEHKILVAYFSATGTTARVAALLADAASADLYEIQPAQPYSAADLNWNNTNSRSSLEMNDPASRPALAGPAAEIRRYGTVFVGFPIWWYVAPTILNTFLEQYDFSGKTVIPFATSGGSGLGRSLERLKPSCSDATGWKPGKLLNRPDAGEIQRWLNDLALSS